MAGLVDGVKRHYHEAGAFQSMKSGILIQMALGSVSGPPALRPRATVLSEVVHGPPGLLE